MEAQEFTGLMAKAGKSGLGAKSLGLQWLGARPHETSILGKGLGGKSPGFK
jgi:hypothetical protein